MRFRGLQEEIKGARQAKSSSGYTYTQSRAAPQVYNERAETDNGESLLALPEGQKDDADHLSACLQSYLIVVLS